MGKIKNVATLTKNGQANINRTTIGHRATWMGLIYDESRKAGIDPEPILRKAIRKCGNIYGESLKVACSGPEDCRDFAEVLLSDLGRKTFEQGAHQVTETEVLVGFHYYAPLNAWRKLGFDDEACAVLCDITMDGDRGIAEAMGLGLELTDTLAEGCPTYELCFHK